MYVTEDYDTGLTVKSCACPDCRSGGAWEYVHKHANPLCIFNDAVSARRAAEHCGICKEGM